MSQTLLTGLVVVAALACPLHMWWMNRRGKRAACCPPRKDERPMDIAALRARRDEIEAQLAEHDIADRTPAAGVRR
mgnify:CR=1 FL=1